MDNKLEITPNGINGIIFKINSEEKIIDDYESLCNIIDVLEEYKKYIEFIIPLKNYYETYESGIDNMLTKQKARMDDEDKLYSFGGYFSFFLECDIETATKKIIELYESEYGKNHKLEIDPDSDYICVYTENYIEAKQFCLLTYQKIIKPFFDKIKKPS